VTKVSRKPVPTKDEERFWDDFLSAVTSLENKKETKGFLTEILTPTERIMIAKRLQIVMMLFLKYDYQEIKNKVKVTNETIAKMNNLLKEKGEMLRRVGERIIRLKIKKLESWQKKGGRRPKTLGSVLVEAGTKHVGKEILAEIAKRKKRASIAK